MRLKISSLVAIRSAQTIWDSPGGEESSALLVFRAGPRAEGIGFNLRYAMFIRNSMLAPVICIRSRSPANANPELATPVSVGGVVVPGCERAIA
jgi:hypothetical protein